MLEQQHFIVEDVGIYMNTKRLKTLSLCSVCSFGTTIFNVWFYLNVCMCGEKLNFLLSPRVLSGKCSQYDIVVTKML